MTDDHRLPNPGRTASLLDWLSRHVRPRAPQTPHAHQLSWPGVSPWRHGCPPTEHVHIVVMPTVGLTGHRAPTHERRLILHSPGHLVQEAVVVWDDDGPAAGEEHPA